MTKTPEIELTFLHPLCLLFFRFTFDLRVPWIEFGSYVRLVFVSTKLESFDVVEHMKKYHAYMVLYLVAVLPYVIVVPEFPGATVSLDSLQF